jgi:hypothetical protein
MNACQQVLGKVVFGGGEEAVLAMFSEGEDDDGDWAEESLDYSLTCETCRRPMQNDQGLQQHEKSINHRQQVILQAIRDLLQR